MRRWCDEGYITRVAPGPETSHAELSAPTAIASCWQCEAPPLRPLESNLVAHRCGEHYSRANLLLLRCVDSGR